jgi:hypothetical protein
MHSNDHDCERESADSLNELTPLGQGVAGWDRAPARERAIDAWEKRLFILDGDAAV